MPNGGSDNCMNCALNGANQRSAQIKGFNPDSRVSFCTVRDIVIQSGSAWTYCHYSHGHYWGETEEKGTFISQEALNKLDPSEPMYTVGARSGGYQRIPYFKGISPHTQGPMGNCTLCNEGFEEGVWITSYATDNEFDFGFCCNEHYEIWATKIDDELKLTDDQNQLFEHIENNRTEKARELAYTFIYILENTTPSNIKPRTHPLSFTNDQSWTPVHYALLKLDDDDQLYALLEIMCFKQPMLFNHHGWSPVHLAAYLGKDGAVKELIELYRSSQDQIIKRDLFGKSPVDIAAQEGHLKVIELLLPLTYTNQQELDNALLFASKQGNLFLAEALVNAGADVNTRGHRDWTPLMNAAYHASDLTLTTYLLDQGADKTLKNLSGKDVMDELRPWSTNTNESLLELIEKHVKTK